MCIFLFYPSQTLILILSYLLVEVYFFFLRRLEKEEENVNLSFPIQDGRSRLIYLIKSVQFMARWSISHS